VTPHQRKIAAIVSRLLEWYPNNARDLPWRRTSDPYGVFVSEIMLQQTQVKTVIPYYERWMKSLPTIERLAQARPERLHKLWEGLGYYTRVRNMQRAAQVIMERHGGTFPQDYDAVLALPGIGRYTAGAICSIAFNQPRPILDGNVIRVLTRVFGIAGDPRGKATNAQLWDLAAHLVSHVAADSTREPGSRRSRPRARSRLLFDEANDSQRDPSACSHFNQALMELGALVCTPRQPKCSECPLKSHCFAFAENKIDRLPRPTPRPRSTPRTFAAFVLERNGKFLVRQRPAGVVNAHLWEFPNVETNPRSGSLANQLQRALSTGQPSARAGGGPPEGATANRATKLLAKVKHSITRYRITMQVFQLAVQADALDGRIAGQWKTREALRKLPFASAHKKVVGLLGKPVPTCS
jgi:A/G-specific adenine glycosylase